MSEFKVQVVRVGEIKKHPNADSLGITKIGEYPVMMKLGEFKEGDLAVYVPVDSIVPVDDPRWAFLDGHNRIKAKKLRGVFSMGLLTKADPSWVEGQEVHNELRIVKYEAPVHFGAGNDENEECPFEFPKYTGIEAYRRYPNIIMGGEEIVATEKIHGTNGRWVWHMERLWCGSHNQIRKMDVSSLYWKAAEKYELGRRLKDYDGFVFYGEIYGWVQDLRYGHKKNEISIAIFDIFDMSSSKWLDYDEFKNMVDAAGLPTVPVLYRGPWSKEVLKYAEGPTSMGGGHVREGIVIRPVKERFDERIGRVILKYHGEGYLLR
ncbi:MAG: RNA ligase (ATP) [Nitrososphaerales archaeon]